MTKIIDIHNHVATPACEELLEPMPAPEFDPFMLYSSPETLEYNRRHFREVADRLTNTERRIEDMDASGVSVQALSVAPPQFYYWTDPGIGRRLCRMQNENLARMVQEHPARFVGLGTVPMQDVDAALEEMDYCISELGFRGIEICTNINGLDLDAQRFLPVFEHAATLGVVIVIHPHGFTHGQRLRDYYMTNVIGNPLETTIAAFRLIHSGLFERVPDVNVVLVHGGGFLPFYHSRMDHSWRERPEGRRFIGETPPSAYLGRFYFDTLVYDAHHLGVLADTVGADRLLVGTDYPYDMGETQPARVVEGCPQLSDGDRERILHGTAERLLGLSDE